MLYDRWLQVARSCRDEIALRDLSTGSKWTFAQLSAAADKPPSQTHQVAFPTGISADFIISVLQAWRTGRVVCPLEPGQAPPNMTGELPPGIIHLKTTSATTGTSRLIAFTAEQLIADAQNIISTMGLSNDWPNLASISLAHSYGFSNLVLPLLLQGIPLILAGSSLPEAVQRAAATERAITLAAVPTLWRLWHEANAIPSNVRLAISAGAPLPLALEHSVFGSHGLKIHNFYGSSECGGIAYDASSGARMDDSCAGAPLQNVCCSIASDGCLEVRSSAVGQTYWPESSSNLGAGVFHTSDLAEISYGLVYLRGRATDQINVAGRKVLPETIEKALKTHPDVRDALVFGVPTAEAGRGERIVACIEVRSGISGESLKQFLTAKLPSWQLPRDCWLVDSLEANERGKLSRAEWRRKYLAERIRKIIG
jgi:acyl-CoA synthetase (AMP-forming)/AMP-acid ligase II